MRRSMSSPGDTASTGGPDPAAASARGLKSLLRLPGLYSLFENLVGARRARRIFVSEYLKPSDDMRILDLGCGPAEVLEFLPARVRYAGYDSNPAYVSAAQRKYSGRGTFRVADVTRLDPPTPNSCDAVIAMFLLHHLDDRACRRVLGYASAALTSAGRLVSIDPCLADETPLLGRWIIAHDRGSYLRAAPAYAALARRHFRHVTTVVRHDLLRIPYSHCLMICRNAT